MKKNVVVLGSTGSIGKTFLKILKKDIDNSNVLLLTTNKNINLLFKQIEIFNVKNIIVKDKKKFFKIKSRLLGKKINIYNNYEELDKIFDKIKIDYTLNAISGLDGLKPTLGIIKFTKNIAIANKESIICGWNLIKTQLIKNNTRFIPIDFQYGH